ncbi:MAG: UrcA family protein [Proteobacteria bacterium]|nr:UrcA family protein [Pseudomonadota bacterium]
MPRIALGVAAALLLCTGAPALAQPGADAPSTTQLNSRVVPYGDLYLDGAAGADTMLRRIHNASRFVCGDRTGPRPMQENGSVQACVGDSMETAVHDLDNPNVTNRYYGNVPEVVISENEDDSGYQAKSQPR